MDKAEIAKNGPYERSYMRNSKRQHGAIFSICMALQQKTNYLGYGIKYWQHSDPK